MIVKFPSLSSLIATFDGSILRGLAAASVWQAANYIIPLITFPYLARVLGASGFGALNFGMAVAGYAVMLTNWGFTWTGTQEIARDRGDLVAVNRIIWTVLLAKSMLATVACTIIMIVNFTIVTDSEVRYVVLSSMLFVLSETITVDWALRGVEQLPKFTIASILGRVASLPLIFILVRERDDVALAAVAWASGNIIAALATVALALHAHIMSWPDTSASSAIRQIVRGRHVFLSAAMAGLLTNGLSIILGATSGMHQVGVFSGAEKIRKAVYSLLSPISMVFYPRMSFLASNNLGEARRVNLGLLRLQGGIAFIISVSVFLIAPWIVKTLLGPGFEGAADVLRIMSGLIFFNACTNVLGLMAMVPFGMKREFTLCVVGGGVLALVFAYPFSVRYGAAGVAAVWLGTEIVVAASMYFLLFRRFSRN